MKKLMKKIGGCRYLVFLDLEGTQESHEMIAIGAIIVSLKKNKTVQRKYAGFKRYVQAEKRIGQYVARLTGITKQILDEKAISYKQTLEEFKTYVGKKWDKCKFITFGTHDIRIFNQSLRHSPDADHSIVKYISKNHIDLSEILSEFSRDDKGNPLSLANYCKVLNLEFVGEQHDPLDDAINLGRLYQAALTSPNIIYEEYLKVLKITNNIPEPIKRATINLADGHDVSTEDFSQYVKEYLTVEQKKK